MDNVIDSVKNSVLVGGSPLITVEKCQRETEETELAEAIYADMEIRLTQPQTCEAVLKKDICPEDILTSLGSHAPGLEQDVIAEAEESDSHFMWSDGFVLGAEKESADVQLYTQLAEVHLKMAEAVATTQKQLVGAAGVYSDRAQAHLS